MLMSLDLEEADLCLPNGQLPAYASSMYDHWNLASIATFMYQEYDNDNQSCPSSVFLFCPWSANLLQGFQHLKIWAQSIALQFNTKAQGYRIPMTWVWNLSQLTAVNFFALLLWVSSYVMRHNSSSGYYSCGSQLQIIVSSALLRNLISGS